MDYCGPRGIPLSEFLSWDEADQDAALVWQAHEARRCPSCHTHPDTWDETKGGRRDAYLAELVVCPGCRTLEAARKREEKNANQPLGAHLMLRPRTILDEGA
jgi:hypothetical protein